MSTTDDRYQPTGAPSGSEPVWNGHEWVVWNGQAWEIPGDQMRPPSPPPVPQRRISGTLIAILIGVAALVALGVLAVGLTIFSGSGGIAGVGTPAGFTSSGTFTLIDTSTSYSGITSTGSTCEGRGGYSDIHAGTQVVVKSASGEVLATGSLTGGTPAGMTACTFSYSVGPIPGGQANYGMTVSQRGDLYYSEAELKDGPDLSLGD
ncbi:MAG: hypothetical protein ACOYD0_06950 [Candidatus Nanopelagicales bacterium]